MHAILNAKARMLFPGTFRQAGAETPCHPSENGAVTTFVALAQNANACYGVLSCATLSHMAKHISIRLWDDVLAAVDKAAKEEERDRSQVINRALRSAFGLGQVKLESLASMQQRAQDRAEEKIVEGIKRSGMCGHGREKKFCVYCQKTEKAK